MNKRIWISVLVISAMIALGSWLVVLAMNAAAAQLPSNIAMLGFVATAFISLEVFNRICRPVQNRLLTWVNAHPDAEDCPLESLGL